MAVNEDKRLNRLLGQFNRAIKKSGVVQYKKSKKDDQLKAVSELKKEGIKYNSHDVSLKTGVHSPDTYNNFYSTIRSFSNYISKNHDRIKNIEGIGRKTVAGFLKDVINKGYKLETYNNYKSDLTKLQQVMTHHFKESGNKRSTDFFDKAKDDIKNAKLMGDLEKGYDSRSYENPRAIIDNIKREDHRLVAAVQLEAGGRINEASLVDEKRLGGIVEHMGREVGVIHLQKGDAKGGLARDLYLPRETYEKISEYVAKNGKLHVEKGHQRDVYRQAIRTSAEEVGQKYSGSHGFRHNFAQDRVKQLVDEGMSYRVALTAVAVEMGHFREDITEHYLKN